MKQVSFKLIFRSWRRNKLFTVISVLSLAIGLACTNMLAAFVIHEYNVETENPNRDHIYFMSQDSPLQSGEQVAYIVSDIAPKLKDGYPFVKDYLRLGSVYMQSVWVGENSYPPILSLQADSSFWQFFPYEVVYGNLREALTEPNKIALTEEVAKLYFDGENPLGQTISYTIMEEDFFGGGKESTVDYQVVAVIKARDQSILSFDAIGMIPSDYHGGTAILLTEHPIDTEAFAQQVKADGIPTIQGDIGQYYFIPLRERYFLSYTMEGFNFVVTQQKPLLYVGVFSSILILLIACFNYVNLNFSRLLQQVKMIHTQKLMGADRGHIIGQLFLDTFLTVVVGFLFSLLIIYTLLPHFNAIVGGRMQAAFLLNQQVFPILCGFVLILSIVPALYVGRKVTRFSLQGYYAFFRGGKRQVIVASLTVLQFAISIGLVMGTLIVNQQVGLIKRGGEAYQGLIEVGEWSDKDIRPLVQDIQAISGIGKVTATGFAVLNSGLQQVVTTDEHGNESYYPLLFFKGDTDYLETFRIQLKQGFSPEEGLEQWARPVYVNETFVRLFVPEGENPVGQPLQHYQEVVGRDRKGEEAPPFVVAGVLTDFYTNTLEDAVFPSLIQIERNAEDVYCIYFRLNRDRPELLSEVKAVWEKHFPGSYFSYRHVWDEFKERNHKVFSMSRLLWMYSLISLFLTCFGLFGMALYAMEQRTKEIGIRKVNGATTTEIMLLLNRQFLVWVGIAFLIALPLTWWLIGRWLENFVYRVHVSVGVALLSGLLVGCVTLLTVSWHSYRAASRNPVNALRSE